MASQTLLLLCNCPDRAAADKIASELVEKRLAACVNLVPGFSSIYMWQGKLETAEEVTLLIKSTRQRYEELETAILELHPYELPEIIAVPVELGFSDYLNWIEECTAK
jgi:periplasmic divalent cation tolerance protein